MPKDNSRSCEECASECDGGYACDCECHWIDDGDVTDDVLELDETKSDDEGADE